MFISHVISFHLIGEIFSPKALRQSLGLEPALHWSLCKLSGEVKAENQYHMFWTKLTQLKMKLTGSKKKTFFFFIALILHYFFRSWRPWRQKRLYWSPRNAGTKRYPSRFITEDFSCFNQVKKTVMEEWVNEKCFGDTSCGESLHGA